MINILVKFDSSEQFRETGIRLGYIPSDIPTPDYENGIFFLVIGDHLYLNEDGELIKADGWWVRISAPEGTIFPDEILNKIVEPLKNIGTEEEPEVPQVNWMT
jgi:hypothetical protein